MPTARVFRVKKRGIMDIHATAIRPRIIGTMNQIGQKIVFHAQRNHEFKNRTGALEASLAWSFPEYRNHQFVMIIAAGGWSRAKYSLDFGRRKATGVGRRNRRYQRGQVFRPKRGQGLFVNYAPFVERKGYSVLSKSVEKYRRESGKILGHGLQLRGGA